MPENAAQISSSRKDDHLRFALEQAHNRTDISLFDELRFVHQALSAINPQSVDLNTSVLGAVWQYPLYINAMTGGSQKTALINSGLAEVAHETRVAIASGSMSPIFKDPDTEMSFRVLRDKNPDGFLLANLSANATLDQAKKAVDLIAADALQIHINAVQELLMREGDREFGQWSANIEEIVARVGVPVVVKEVGFGLSRRAIQELSELGVKYVDIAGRGGTNFAQIEQSRQSEAQLGELTTWGIQTPEALLDIQSLRQRGEAQFFASGGIRNPLDGLKALALGASGIGVAGGFLKILDGSGQDALAKEIIRWQEVMRTGMALLGAKNLKQLQNVELLITGQLREFCELRHIDVQQFALRNKQKVRTFSV